MTIPLDDSSPTNRPPAVLSRRGKGFLAVAGTLAFTGLGHLLAGRGRRAAAWLAAALLLTAASVVALLTPALQPALLGLMPAVALFQIACLIDAYRAGRNSPRAMLGAPIWRYAAGAGLILLSAFCHPATLLVKVFLTPRVQGFVMPTRSMMPTVNPGDRFLVLKTAWQVRRWDLIAFHPPGNPETANEIYLKRVVGLPGEKIEIVGGKVRVNDQPVDPPEAIGPYTTFSSIRLGHPPNGVEGNPIFLGPGEYFVLGDNSPISGDSRLWADGAPGHQPGAVPAESIVGRATVTYWPPSRWRRFR